MIRFGQIAVCLAGGLVLNTGLCADQGVSQKNPYEPIVTRNIFDLNPPQAVNPAAKPEPPAKIKVDGIMTIFGGVPQALYKVAVPAHPPKPASEKSYILSEGQGQDGIEVTHIDLKAGMVTFNNHGVLQELPLVKAPPQTTPTPVVMHRGITPPGRPPIAFNRGGGMAHFGNRSVPNRGPENNGGNYDNSGNVAGNVGSAGYSPNMQGTPPQRPLTPEEQMLMIAAEHAHAQQEGNPIAAIYPPTPLDEAAGVTPANNSNQNNRPPTPSPPAP